MAATLSGVTIAAGSLVTDDQPGVVLTMSGGSIGAGATVEADDGSVDVLGTVANSGTLEAAGRHVVSGTVDISGTVDDAAAGVILASRGGQCRRRDHFRRHVRTSSGGVITVSGAGEFDQGRHVAAERARRSRRRRHTDAVAAARSALARSSRR